MVAAAINVDFDLEIFPWNLVTGLAQSTTARGRPQQGELLRTQSNFAFFARSAAANLEGERNSFGFFSQANVTAARLVREITLRDLKMARAQNFDRQSLDLKYPLVLAGRDEMCLSQLVTARYSR